MGYADYSKSHVAQSGDVIDIICADCERVFAWQRVGDSPVRCYPCNVLYKRHGGGGKGGNAWDLSGIKDDDELLTQLDSVLHYSPEINRWMYWEGHRWIKGSELDARSVALAVLRRRGAVPRTHHHGMGEISGSMLEALKEMRRPRRDSKGRFVR